MTQAKKILAGGITEAEAIDRAKRGDAAAFEALYGLHKRRVYSLCLRMVGNTAEAEDLTQEAFLQLYRKIATFRGESAFSTWLHRLAVNVVLMHLRKKGLNEVSLDEQLEPQQEDGPKRDIGARDNMLAGSIDRVNLERAIESLPPGYRIIFVLHDVEGYEHNEIAEMMGCSIGNSKSQLHKARMKLRDLLRLSKATEKTRHYKPNLPQIRTRTVGPSDTGFVEREKLYELRRVSKGPARDHRGRRHRRAEAASGLVSGLRRSGPRPEDTSPNRQNFWSRWKIRLRECGTASSDHSNKMDSGRPMGVRPTRDPF